jgi:iron complex transport system ATP-binding protein
VIEARNLTVVRNGRTLLEQVSLTLTGGELVGILGPNGAGKTTLLRTLVGLRAPTSGSVLLEGRPLGARSRREIAQSLAWLPQGEATDLELPAYEIALMGRLPHRGPLEPWTAADHDTTRAALGRVHALELASRGFPSLSAGEKQRILLARALAQSPRALFLDEPTANLDPRHAWRTFDVLSELARKGTTVVAALHDLSLAGMCTRVIVLANGRIAEDAPPDRALSPTVLREVFGIEIARHVMPDGTIRLIPIGAFDVR